MQLAVKGTAAGAEQFFLRAQGARHFRLTGRGRELLWEGDDFEPVALGLETRFGRHRDAPLAERAV